MKTPVSRLAGAILVTALALFLALAPFTLSRAQPPTPAGPERPFKVISSSDKLLNKLHPKLRQQVSVPSDETLLVRITAVAGTDVGPHTLLSFTRPFKVLGESVTFARVRPAQLLILAAMPGVIRIEPITLERTLQPFPPFLPGADPRPSIEELRARIKALKAIDTPWSEAQAAASAPGGYQPMSWYDVRKGHHSIRAWMKGYRGQGVKVAVLDTGTDLAHPDLQGTWAMVTDRNSPYFGWPVVFDPLSMMLYATDRFLGTNNMATGATWYVDTRTTPQVTRSFDDVFRGIAHAHFAPFAASQGRGNKQPGVMNAYTIPYTTRSGVVHMGSHPDAILAQVYGEHVAVLLVDEHRRGVYDTVYVDLDNDHDFTDEKPVTRESPAVYRDMDGDGYADLSGGIVYFIADGQTPIPGSDWFYGLPAPEKAELVAFMGDFGPAAGHGTLTASNVVGQARINGLAPTFRDLPGDGKPNGMVIGAAPEAKLVAVGDIYVSFPASAHDAYLLTMLGYDGQPGTDDDVQITSNSYGRSDVDNDGWDYDSRYIDRWVRRLNPTVSMVFATGNGAPGYGTLASPAPNVAINVGASTQMGSTGWDSITSTGQINFGDVVAWSNRGPGAQGTNGPHVVANGALGSGDIPVNFIANGWHAWGTWGGTSRSTPVAAGNLALVYQAFRERHGRWPTYTEARAILMAGADHIGHDTLVQGAGLVNADVATDIAAGRHGVYPTPVEWNPGDYRGTEYPAFTRMIHPGGSDTQAFTFTNDSTTPVTLSLSAQVLRRIGSHAFDFTTRPVTEEPEFNFSAPDYLIPLDRIQIPENTDLMVVRMTYPFQQFDPNGDYLPDQVWYLGVYNWTDIDGDGRLWDDADGDGIVDHETKTPYQPANNDGLPAVDWGRTEIDRWEYARTSFLSRYTNNPQVWVRRPHAQAHDGLFIGLQHPLKSRDIPTTTLAFRIDFYAYEDWDWLGLEPQNLTVPASGTAEVNATLSVPVNTPYGEYQGAIFADYAGPRWPFRVYLPIFPFRYGGQGKNARVTQVSPASPPAPARRIVIPVLANVAASFDGTGTLTFGGPTANDPDAPYNNGVVRGSFDWTWRSESGDWRFFFLDVLEEPAEGSRLVIRSTWDDPGPPTDIDTLIYGPASDRFSDPNHPDNAGEDNWADPDYFGPYTLQEVNKSLNTLLFPFGGIWRFETATGSSQEWVAGSLDEGLHMLMLHNVLFSGQQFDVPFTATLGNMRLLPTAVNFTAEVTDTATISGCMPVTFTTGLELPALAVEGFGFSTPEVFADQVVRQDNPEDPMAASFQHEFALNHASRLDVELRTSDTGNVIVVIVLYDQNGDGEYDLEELLGFTFTAFSPEASISFLNPDDGNYLVLVWGASVPTGEALFTLTLNAIQGTDISVQGVPEGAISIDTPYTFDACYAREVEAGVTLKGEVLIGPSVAPGVLRLPVTLTAE